MEEQVFRSAYGGFALDADESEYRLDNTELHKYQSLWRAVIMQAFLDSVTNSSRTEDKLARIQSHSWLYELSDDFVAVCNMANYSPCYVKKKFLKIVGKYNKNKKNNIKQYIINNTNNARNYKKITHIN